MAKHYIVKGRVQGVWFRQSTMQKALLLNLSGWVRNLSNGDVEVCAAGEDKSLAEFEAWLWQGPDAARVDDICISECDHVSHGFQVRR